MRERLHLRYPVIVEGKYDKITLSALVDTPVFATGGFSVFNSGELRALLRRLATSTPLILLTDSDGGGRQIRAYLSGILPKDRLIQLFIPEIPGKESRKRAPGKAGLLGVEGMEASLLTKLLAPYATDVPPVSHTPVTKTDFYADGLSGGEGSAALRARLALALGLPHDMTANALLTSVNLLLGREAYQETLAALREENG